jgi:hypothetical protein
MARLLAITPKTDHFAKAVIADIKAGIYDAAVLVTPETQKPYALLAPITEEQVNAAKDASRGRRHRFYCEQEFRPELALDSGAFSTTRLLVDNSTKGSAIGLGSLDCCVFFGIYFVSSRVWNEKVDTECQITLSSGFRRAVRGGFSESQKQDQKVLRENSLYLSGLNL